MTGFDLTFSTPKSASILYALSTTTPRRASRSVKHEYNLELRAQDFVELELHRFQR